MLKEIQARQLYMPVLSLHPAALPKADAQNAAISNARFCFFLKKIYFVFLKVQKEIYTVQGFKQEEL